MTEKETYKSSSSSPSSSSSSSANSWQGFIAQANTFVELTSEHVLQGINPGGVYQAIWCRDASYILGDWFFSGNLQGALQQIYQIWNHQIAPNREKIVYGRGSPDLKFSANAGGIDIQKKFEGALPTTIYQVGFSEVYGKNPDIDSTALMIGTSSFILARAPRKEKTKEEGDSLTSTVASEHSADYVTSLLSKVGITDPSNVIEFVVPRMLRAVEYLESRDIDNDGLLEQAHNEDWMDTALRAGKIVYSQGCWIYGLIHLSVLLSKLGKSKEATRINRLAEKAIDAVNQKLWSEEDGTYLDIVQGLDSSNRENDQIYRLLTQDVTYFLTAITANTVNDSFKAIVQQQEKKQQQQIQEKNEPIKIPELHHQRSISTLDAIEKRVWKDKWPLVTEKELPKTGPWPLKPYQYHNHTCWPWTTGVEMLARSRFNQVEECNILLSKLISRDKKSVGIHTFYEWINPITDEGGGAYPFRTGISTLRLAIVDLVQKIKTKHYIH
jgi:hypothetical protein